MKKNLCLNFISTVLIVTSTSAQAVDILNNQSSTLGTITVTDKAESIDEQKKDEVYQRDITNMYADKETVERYKGAAPADLFQGFNGVYSGDARNSGAVDPNIRGIQGQGRIPVTVDGTEQAVTTWRGYNGANNRNYLDPNLISGITVEKGPSTASGNMSGIGGAVKMRTIDVDDIVKEGEKFGAELKLETSNNSVKERIPDYQWGEDYRLTGNPDIFGDFSPVTLVEPKKKGKFFKDNAVRLAVAVKEDKYDFLAAYSYRSKGNYLAGKGGYHKYEGKINDKWGRELSQIEPNLPFAASVYKPHTEIPNTSNEMKSYLLKGSLKLTDNQRIKLGYRHTDINYGEIMPSRLDFKSFVGWVPQWPLAHVKQDAVNVNYNFNPDNPYINLKAGVWYNKTISDTNTSGGNPREPAGEPDWGKDSWFIRVSNECFRGYHPNSDPHHQFDYDKECVKKIGAEAAKKNPNTNGQYSYVNAAKVNAYNTRKGFNISNKMELTDKLSVTVSGSFQQEKLTSNHLKETANPSSTWESPPRLGRRQEWDITTNFNYRPTDWLILTAGGRYNEYWSYDDYLDKLLKEDKLYKNEDGSPRYMTEGKRFNYSELFSQEDLDKYNEITEKQNEYKSMKGKNGYLVIKPKVRINGRRRKNPDFDPDIHRAYRDLGKQKPKLNMDDGTFSSNSSTIDWKYRKDGRLHREDNPFYNGTLKNKMVKNLVTGKMEPKYKITGANSMDRPIEEKEQLKSIKKQRAHAFSPSFSATAFLTDHSRAWIRYMQYSRMPSIFETTVGFSASAGSVATYDRALKAEKAKNIEIGYAYDLSHLFDNEVKSDVKLSYYHNVTKNVIDRDTNFSFIQFDKRTLEGIELQSRFDNGQYFADFGVEYHLKNKVCDADTANMLDPILQRVPNCITAGFPMGYLRTQLQPKYSITANLGGRFFDRKLELGTRWLYHSKAKNKDENRLYEIDQKDGFVSGLGMNNPMYWQPVLTVDAYAKYKYSKNVTLEFVGTNLTDRYYLDPMTRSMIPAPGRTFKLGLTASF
ncbi:TonB-dependent receptor [Pasteurella atlantica]|uniref:TonB-dependent receptor domain-containing protein n=1 Tax=Pasteurellaceae TaxID=712 RepID=UPI00277092DA|nr:TonB-dependent receptor [Pasteurella atlantica]MDP8032826.1 TonB-dependent receptor [Pasteurella atlantica]MDP8034668.1 TonB-dependent receptor [Pasteurella atlantica]MDP8036618.1 TonB-dependent receptor [Pasteurella atlantica]MDP8047060.1 TonB-dependent receptor [Pasteurella atlantica]MDP8049013.1 TonB-dependent receptor [Pasteurella atlantica]